MEHKVGSQSVPKALNTVLDSSYSNYHPKNIAQNYRGKGMGLFLYQSCFSFLLTETNHVHTKKKCLRHLSKMSVISFS